MRQKAEHEAAKAEASLAHFKRAYLAHHRAVIAELAGTRRQHQVRTVWSSDWSAVRIYLQLLRLIGRP
eukprot:8470708-Pyramimonas_sp.AAC.1